MGLFDNAVRVILNDKVVNRIELVDGGVLYERALPRESTSLSIDVPLNLVYGDSFNITGNLLDSNDTGVNGATVKLKVGSTVVDTTTTNSNGEYGFTHCPVRVGNHSFQVVYSGDSSYRGCDSAVVNRVVDRETSVISVSPSTVYVGGSGDSVSVSGSLVDDDGSVLSGASVSLLVDGTVSSSTTTDGSGAYAFTFNYPDNNTHTFKVRYDGDSNYTASEMVFNVIVSAPDSMTVSKLYDTVSLHGSPNTNILSATVLDANLSPCEAVEVVFSVGGVDATVLTDANGVANYTYTAQSVSGTGEVSVIVSCGSLVETCTFYDYIIYEESSSQDRLSLFGELKHLSGSRISQLSWDNAQNAYKIVNNSGYAMSAFPITVLTGIENIHFEMDIKAIGRYAYPALAVYYWHPNATDSEDTNKDIHTRGIDGTRYWSEGTGTHTPFYKYTSGSVSQNTWYHIIVDIIDSECTFKIYDESQISLLYSETRALSRGEDYIPYYCLNCGYDGGTTKYYKNIEVIEL